MRRIIALSAASVVLLSGIGTVYATGASYGVNLLGVVPSRAAAAGVVTAGSGGILYGTNSITLTASLANTSGDVQGASTVTFTVGNISSAGGVTVASTNNGYYNAAPTSAGDQFINYAVSNESVGFGDTGEVFTTAHGTTGAGSGTVPNTGSGASGNLTLKLTPQTNGSNKAASGSYGDTITITVQ
jgi:hypothetical protein